MFCHNCGTKLDEGSLFCPECGAKQQNADQPSAEPAPSTPPQSNEDIPGSQDSEKKTAKDHSWKDKRPVIVIALIVVVGILVGFLSSKKLQAPKNTGSDTMTADSMNAADKNQDISTGKEEKQKETEEEKEDADETGGSDATDVKSNSNDIKKEDTKKDSEKEDTDKKTDGKDDGKKNEDKNADKKKEDTDSDEKKPAEKIYTHEYTIIQGMKTWTDAKAYCETQGGHLATAVSQEEYEQIAAKANATGCLVLWLGAQRSPDTGNFEWVTDEDFSYGAWAAGEPNNDGGSENYLGMMKVNGVWGMYDMPGDVSPYYSASKVGFVMEKDIEQ